jgi:hypothetical protein
MLHEALRGEEGGERSYMYKQRNTLNTQDTMSSASFTFCHPANPTELCCGKRRQVEMFLYHPARRHVLDDDEGNNEDELRIEGRDVEDEGSGRSSMDGRE